MRLERWKMNKTIWALFLAALVGMTAGILAPEQVDATPISVELRVYSGASGYLTCGWHGECPDYPATPTGGDALDWDNSDNGDVYWRSYGYRSDNVTGKIA